MELLYCPPPQRRRLNFLGVAAATVSMLVFALPAAAIAVSAWVISAINLHTKVGMFVGWHLADAHNFALVALPLLGFLIGAAGVIASRNKCALSAMSAAFNLTILLNG